ncbi:MAG: hypothetical protein Q8L90_13030 [Bacteroidota bacterium]|nr:hypothetical protein [Bacteroidota bacterium]
MKRKANASAKTNEVQPIPQANTRLHHICFCRPILVITNQINIKLLSTALVLIGSLIGCLSNDSTSNLQKKTEKSDLAKMNLSGKVKSVKEFYFEVEKKFDSLIKLKTEIPSDSYTLFDNSGNIIKKYGSGGDDSIGGYYRQNDSLKLKHYKGTYKYLTVITYYYDNIERLIEENYIDNCGNLTYQYSYKYDEKGNRTEKLIKNYGFNYDHIHRAKAKPENGRYGDNQKWIYTYNNEGHQIESDKYFFDELDTKSIYKYDAYGNQIQEDCYYNRNKHVIRISNKYDIKMNRIEKNVYRPDGCLEHTYAYKYDDKNNVIKEVSSVYMKTKLLPCGSKNRIKNDSVIYKYEYDNKGNWVSKNTILIEKPSLVTERQIEYY